MISLELAALNLSLGCEERFLQLQAVFFENPIVRALYDKIRNNYIKTNYVVNIEGLKALSFDLIPEFNKEEIEAIIEGIATVKTDSKEFDLIISKLKNLSEIRQIIPAINEVNNSLKNNDIINTKKFLFDIVSNLSPTNDGIINIGSKDITPFEEPKFGKHIPTGYEHLDDIIYGFFGEELIVISAKRGTGKSALALNLGRNMHQLGFSPVYLNLEMGRREWLARYLSLISSIPYKKIRTGNLSIKDKFVIQRFFIREVCQDATRPLKWHEENRKELCMIGFEQFISKLKENFRKYLKNKSYGCYSLDIKPSTAEIGLKVKELVQKKICDILIIDYINFIKSNNVSGKIPMWQELMEIGSDLKYIAKSYKIPIIVLTQLEPKEKDVKYSRAISEIADTVFTWEPAENNSREVEVIDYSDKVEGCKKLKDELSFKISDIEENKRIYKIKCDVFDFYTVKTRNIPEIKKGTLNLINILKFMKCNILNPTLIKEFIEQSDKSDRSSDNFEKETTQL